MNSYKGCQKKNHNKFDLDIHDYDFHQSKKKRKKIIDDSFYNPSIFSGLFFCAFLIASTPKYKTISSALSNMRLVISEKAENYVTFALFGEKMR